MRARDPRDDPPAKRDRRPIERAALAHLLQRRALLPSQRGYRRRPLAGRNRASGPGPEGGLLKVRDNRRRRETELE
jgi:hypothetical protein